MDGRSVNPQLLHAHRERLGGTVARWPAGSEWTMAEWMMVRWWCQVDGGVMNSGGCLVMAEDMVGWVKH